MERQTGFTLIELIIVIVVLGILAAYTVPKFMSVDREARVSVIKSLRGSVQAASDMVRAMALAQNVITCDGSTPPITIADGTTVGVCFGYAKALTAGIGSAVNVPDSVVAASAAGSQFHFTHKDARVDTGCRVTYTFIGTSANVPSVTMATDGC